MNNYCEMELYELFVEREYIEDSIEAEDNSDHIGVLLEELKMVNEQIELVYELEFWGDNK